MNKQNLLVALLLASNTIYATPSIDALIGTQYDADKINNLLSGKNYAVSTDKNKNILQVIITGENGDGSDIKSLNQLVYATQLPKSVQGNEAVALLGDNLEATASSIGMTADSLRDHIINDPTIHVDDNANLFIVEDAPNQAELLNGITTSTKTTAPALTVPDNTDVFKLHSNPTASKTLYIDFNGQVVTSSVWSPSTITAAAFDVDGVPEVFSAGEQATVMETWKYVAEDYAGYDIDVTTEEPTNEALFRVTAADTTYGTRVVVTKSGTIGCGGCGGIAYVNVVNSFPTTAYSPAWVFHNALLSTAKYMAEAVSHEAGHTFGLIHDGLTTGAAYYGGHGDAITGWAPIMGVGYSKTTTQFSKGEYPLANNKQDDLAVIISKGIAAKVDDFGNTITEATLPELTLTGNINTLHAYGVIETSSDADVFVIPAGAGNINITVNGSPRSNLNTSLTLLNSAGNVVATDNDPSNMDASINVTVTAGTYYLVVAGQGKIMNPSDAGYSVYGSMGQYEIKGTLVAGAITPTPKPVVVTPTPKPVVVTPTPNPVVITPTPKPVVITPTPKPVVITPTPKPVVITPTPNPNPVVRVLLVSSKILTTDYDYRIRIGVTKTFNFSMPVQAITGYWLTSITSSVQYTKVQGYSNQINIWSAYPPKGTFTSVPKFCVTSVILYNSTTIPMNSCL
jgi:hypothetical protein